MHHIGCCAGLQPHRLVLPVQSTCSMAAQFAPMLGQLCRELRQTHPFLVLPPDRCPLPWPAQQIWWPYTCACAATPSWGDAWPSAAAEVHLWAWPAGLLTPAQVTCPAAALHGSTLLTLPAVKVINCDGTADASNVLAGLDWLSANVKFPAVASMSLGADTPNQALDDAVTALIQQGTLAVIAAGNFNQSGQSQMHLLQQVSRMTEVFLTGHGGRLHPRVLCCSNSVARCNLARRHTMHRPPPPWQ